MAEHVTVTPTGIAIAFEDGEPDEGGTSKRRAYLVNGTKLPSVTTVLGILDKPGLRFAAEKIGVAGAVQLAGEGALPQDPAAAMEALQDRGLTHWQVWAQTARRGDLAHTDLVALLTGQEPADIDQVREEDRGFLRGIAEFCADRRPVVVDSETLVASTEYGFAGRYDLCCALGSDLVRLDLKTTGELPRYKDGQVKPPYDENVLQLAAYELAARESGFASSDWQGVLRVDASGAWDLTRSWLPTADVFLAVLAAHRALKAAAKARPKWRKLVAA
ncbi:MAG: hypothetical protein ACR2KP_04625 [Egibacteraceae bacterium]